MQNRILPLAMLFLSLVASEASSATREDHRIAALRAVLQKASNYESDQTRSDAQFAVAFVDLNGDGVDEAIVYGPQSSGSDGWCGTGGCGIGIFVRHGRMYRLKSSTSLGWPPVGVLKSSHYGWRDLTVFDAGGGEPHPHSVVLQFNGSRYPYNPSVPPAFPLKDGGHQEVLIKAEPSGSRWVTLFPSRAQDKCRQVEARPSAFGPLPVRTDRPC
jgi:hypothetical protein